MKRKVAAKIVNPLLGDTIALPDYATEGSAAMDLRACIEEPVTLPPGETRLIGSGIAISIRDPGLVAIIAPRSGLGIKHGICLGNGIGVIDSDYAGEIKIGLWNRGNQPYTVQPGERICQLLFVPVVQVELEWVAEFSEATRRGAGGFGHTGRH